MRTKVLESLTAALGPVVLSDGYVWCIIKGCRVTITYGTIWRATIQYAYDVEHYWEHKTLFGLLKYGVQYEACPFDETTLGEWKSGPGRRIAGIFSTPPTRPAAKRKKSSFIAISTTSYEPALCHNCDGVIPIEASSKGAAFCCDRCSEVATTIRAARASWKNGKYHEKTVDGKDSMTKMVTDLKIAFVSFGNGYPKKARYLTPEQKQAIMRRDHHTCQMCGRMATDIDHIKGSSSDPSNLRALCKNCNVSRALDSLPVLTPEQETIKASIWAAIKAKRPARLCYDELRWQQCWREVQRIHKEVPTQAEREALFGALARKHPAAF